MPLYSCECCLFSSKIKTHYIRHLKTLKHIKNVENSVIESVSKKKEPKRTKKEPKKNQKNQKVYFENSLINYKEQKYKCEYCLDKFNTYPSKRRHELHRCKLLPICNSVQKVKNTIKNKNCEIKELKSQMNLLISKIGTTTNNTIINTTNNIQLNSYGKEDLSHITEKLKTNLLQIPYGMIPKMIEVVHFNDQKPENKNIKLTNKKDNKIKIFSGNKWIYKNKEDTINNLINEKYFILDTHYDIINDRDINKNKYENFRIKYDKHNKDMLEKLKKECELVLLNNR